MVGKSSPPGIGDGIAGLPAASVCAGLQDSRVGLDTLKLRAIAMWQWNDGPVRGSEEGSKYVYVVPRKVIQKLNLSK